MAFCECGEPVAGNSTKFCKRCREERKQIIEDRKRRKKEMCKCWWMRPDDDRDGIKDSQKKRKRPRFIR